MNSTDNFMDDEKLYRAVYPASRAKKLWQKNGRISSAAFKDPCGCSVERAKKRTNEEVIKSVKERLQGCVVSVTVSQCKKVEACVKYIPTKKNENHSEIHKDEAEILLTDGQSVRLAREAAMEYFEE
jgi:hypothetical protein